MKKFFVQSLGIVLIVSSAGARDNTGNASNDFGQSNGELKQVSTTEMSWRFHVSGEVFILSKDGEKLVNTGSETRDWSFGGQEEKPIISNWSLQQSGLPSIAIRQEWTLEKSGKISVNIQQYDSLERNGADVKYGKLLKEEKFVVKDFAPINWPITEGEKRIVVRLTPGLWPNSDVINIGAMPITGKNIVVFDSTGKVWAEDISGDHPAPYLGATTHEGSLFLSYLPFKGSKPLGEAKGGRMKLKNGKAKIFLQSETPFTPRDVKVQVYGIIRPSQRTERSNSVRTYSSDKEDDFIKRISQE